MNEYIDWRDVYDDLIVSLYDYMKRPGVTGDDLDQINKDVRMLAKDVANILNAKGAQS